MADGNDAHADRERLDVEYTDKVGWRWRWLDRQGAVHYGHRFHLRRGQAMADLRYWLDHQVATTVVDP